MRTPKKGITLAFAVAAALAGTVATSSPASAASSPIEICGGGSYHVIDQHNLESATAYLLYNGTYNCVVTVKKTTGTTTYIGAMIRIEGSANYTTDLGRYQFYAGPVKVKAPGRCIEWGGVSPEVYFASEPVHCG